MANYMKKSKKTDATVTLAEDEGRLKDTPILLPDGVPVTKGMKIYSVNKLDVINYIASGDYVMSHSGLPSSRIIESSVISVNQAANVRSFTVRSDRGCETSYTVKNSCLPKIFGSKAAAIAEQKRFHELDVQKLQAKIDSRVEQIEKFRTTIAKLKRVKF